LAVMGGIPYLARDYHLYIDLLQREVVLWVGGLGGKLTVREGVVQGGRGRRGHGPVVAFPTLEEPTQLGPEGTAVITDGRGQCQFGNITGGYAPLAAEERTDALCHWLLGDGLQPSDSGALRSLATARAESLFSQKASTKLNDIIGPWPVIFAVSNTIGTSQPTTAKMAPTGD